MKEPLFLEDLWRSAQPGARAFDPAQVSGLLKEGSFAGYTIPTRMRVGWHFGTDRFEPEGEFFRVTIDDAAYR